MQHMLEDIDSRWRDQDGTFAGRLAAADPKTASLCSRLFNECYGEEWLALCFAARACLSLNSFELSRIGNAGKDARYPPFLPQPAAARPPSLALRFWRLDHSPLLSSPHAPDIADMLEKMQHSTAEMPAELKEMHK